jgi:hypothetical protein
VLIAIPRSTQDRSITQGGRAATPIGGNKGMAEGASELGADEDTDRFEEKLCQIASVKPNPKNPKAE